MDSKLDLEMHLFIQRNDKGKIISSISFDRYEFSNLGDFVYLYHTVTFAEGHQMSIFTGTVELEGVTIINEDGTVRK